jgi:isohexenylglutaconyl-CoA hydratase
MEQSFTAAPKPGARDPIAVSNREYGSFLEMVNTTPQVVVAAVEGYAIAGGFGLLCVSDVAICTEDAGFAMSETAIGIVPAQIAPFVAARIGVPNTRHLALTAARFKGADALRYGIVHHLVKDSAALDAKLEEVLKQIDRCAPLATALTKAVVMKVGSEPLSSVLDFAADRFAEARRSPEAAEGLRAFAEKRPPKWAVE